MREIYFHEDEFCQIELLPEANWGFCASQMTAIDEFSDQHRTEAGWDDMNVRSENPLSLDTLSIDKDSLVTSLSELLPSFDHILTGYGSYAESCTQTMALGRNEHVVVFAAHDADNTITSLWLRLDVSTSDEADLAMKAFQILGKWPLILADWGWSVLIRLSDSQALGDYLGSRVTAFEEFNRKMNENRDR